jgi:hypothetical protein
MRLVSRPYTFRVMAIVRYPDFCYILVISKMKIWLGYCYVLKPGPDVQNMLQYFVCIMIAVRSI